MLLVFLPPPWLVAFVDRSGLFGSFHVRYAFDCALADFKTDSSKKLCDKSLLEFLMTESAYLIRELHCEKAINLKKIQVLLDEIHNRRMA